MLKRQRQALSPEAPMTWEAVGWVGPPAPALTPLLLGGVTRCSA